jgi:CO/xanthine dehydrogenase FAD-binding subunit
MILEYHRPSSLDEALELLARPGTITWPLGGGTLLNRPSNERFAVVDLQALGLDKLESRGSILHIGAMVTLQSLMDYPGLQPALQTALRSTGTHNLRQVATIAGTLVGADGCSPFAAIMLALDASLEVKSLGSDTVQISLGNLLPLRMEILQGKLITSVDLPLNVRLAYEYVSRTPADLPIVCAALACWPSGRTRLTLGGFGDAPKLALDGPEPGGIQQAARDAYSQTGDDWASAEYRREIAAVLALRCAASLS